MERPLHTNEVHLISLLFNNLHHIGADDEIFAQKEMQLFVKMLKTFQQRNNQWDICFDVPLA